MHRICASCSLHLGEIPGTAHAPDAVSHGLCEGCAHHFMAQVGLPMDEYLEGFDVPIAVVASDSTVSYANGAAQGMLGKSLPQIAGFRGGEVFECEHARLPEGCGATVHCSGCVIRRTVMDTVATGRSHRGVPAHLQQAEDVGGNRLLLSITTEKVGGVVCLRIDEATIDNRTGGTPTAGAA